MLSNLNQIAENYVKLVLNVGCYDPYLVDAYSGPSSWQTNSKYELNDLAAVAADLAEQLTEFSPASLAALEVKRHTYLIKHVNAIKTKICMLQGQKFSFDQESQELYDSVATTAEFSYLDQSLKNLSELLPGDQELSIRANSFRNRFIIKPEYLNQTFAAAVDYCQQVTKTKIKLPENESFKIEYITGQPWSAYNWFKGEAHSLIQVNTDLPIFIDRAVDLAAHEGYPGHHVYHSLLENKLLKQRGWVEYYVNPLFSPQSLIAEGTANAGINIVLPTAERANFEKNVLYPKANLDPNLWEDYEKFCNLLHQLQEAEIIAARALLDGANSEKQTHEFLQHYCLLSPERAAKRIDFIKRYRAYIINYTHGQKLVENYLKSLNKQSISELWHAFETLISEPCVASDLTQI